ncbi:MAG: hypothetical protein ACRDAP_01195, partial [Shewanella sp.]
ICIHQVPLRIQRGHISINKHRHDISPIRYRLQASLTSALLQSGSEGVNKPFTLDQRQLFEQTTTATPQNSGVPNTFFCLLWLTAALQQALDFFAAGGKTLPPRPVGSSQHGGI